jgi:aarF domain-containing kinase
MSGRRLLDAAKLFNATRGIAKQHLALRAQQLDAFNKTSTLAKAVKNQTDRVTLTAQAAAALARKLNEEAPAYAYSTAYPSPPKPQARTETQTHTRHEESIPREESVGKGWDDAGYGREGIEQDHHYVADEKNATVDPPPVGQLEVKQEEATQHPMPDGTIPTTNAAFEQGTLERYRFASHELSSEGARQFQRQSEAQIPAVTSTDSSKTPPDKLSADHDQDIYYERPTTTNHDYSSLPRAKIPKNTGQVQEGGKNLDERGINADTFYSAGGSAEARDALASEQELSPGVDINVFRTSRGSNLLGAKPSKVESKPKILPEAADEMRQFAADMAEDAALGVSSSTYSIAARVLIADSPIPERRRYEYDHCAKLFPNA